MKKKSNTHKKIHKNINGQCLHINKRWSDLKLSQKEFIGNKIREEYLLVAKDNNNKPSKEQYPLILDKVYKAIDDRNINIPHKEVQKYFHSKITKLNKSVNKHS